MLNFAICHQLAILWLLCQVAKTSTSHTQGAASVSPSACNRIASWGLSRIPPYNASQRLATCRLQSLISLYGLRWYCWFILITPSTNPSQPLQKRASPVGIFPSAALTTKRFPAPGRPPKPSYVHQVGRIQLHWKSHQLRILWCNPTASLHWWWCRYWRHIFQCLSKSKQTGRKQQCSAHSRP